MIIALQVLVYFRQSLLAAIDRILQPYYKRLSLAFSRKDEDSGEEESDDQVFSEFDDEKGVVFFPPVYAQRYAAVSDCLMDERWRGKLEKVVDFGYHDMSFIKYLKEVPGIQRILGVDIESLPLKCSSDVFDDYTPRRETPLQISLFQGNAADPDYRLIGCDAVIAIEMIEHMLPHDLDRFIHTVFGFIKPWIVVFTTPNGDFNVLFKALEKNGLRRWDHFFEWSREQFNDWCSNIVVRYPTYSVTCKGVGPGPPGTLHYGCCSQLALFVHKDYHKQKDLNPNSLALVPRQSPKPSNDLYDCWDSTDSLQEMEAIGPPNGITSFTDFLCTDNRSQITFMVSPSLTTLPICALCPEEELLSSSDKTLQCNLDLEIGKNFLMFDEEYFQVKVPQRRITHRVYEIEDVSSRLNCSTFQVKKFSKTTQNLMAKNKIDALVHTREVVDEIRHLTKTLNFNKCILNRSEGGNIWCNINWGDNAPYWNEYYKVVRQYNCPFETKSEECRILDLVSDEINRIVDTQFEEDISYEPNRVEIPLSHLMSVVQHITDDVDQVRDILEWNGYEIVDNIVIYSRLVVDTTSVVTHDEDWQDNDSFSDWDNITEILSTTVSEGSMYGPEYNDHRMRRALDQKVRNLRLMLTADEDITTELDKVVCRLMKLALRMSRGRNTAPPAKWMQFKLFDLLTLTEKAIERRKKYYVEDSLKAIEFHVIDDKLQNINNLNKIKEDDIINEIVDKYRHILSSPEMTTNSDDNKYIEAEDDIIITTSNEFLKDLEYIERLSPNQVNVPKTSSVIAIDSSKAQSDLDSSEKNKMLNGDVDIVTYRKEALDYENNNSGDAESVTNVSHEQEISKYKKISKNEKDSAIYKATPSGTLFHKYKPKREKRIRSSKTRVAKKLARKISGNYKFVKSSSSKYRTDGNSCIIRPKTRSKENRCFTVRASKPYIKPTTPVIENSNPIPESLIDLCHPELRVGRVVEEFNFTNIVDETDNIVISNKSTTIGSAEKSLLIDTVISEKQETTVHQTYISIDQEEPDISDLIINSEEQLGCLNREIDANLFTRHEVSTENVHSQVIFLNDINEPSTSKGIRHNVSMDVQCGPDILVAYPMLSVSTSLMKISPTPSAGHEIHESVTYDKVFSKEFGTSTRNNNNENIIARSKSVGIKIKDSDVAISAASIDTSTMKLEISLPQDINSNIQSLSIWSPESIMSTSEKLVSDNTKTVDSNIKTESIDENSSSFKAEYSALKFCESCFDGFPKSRTKFPKFSKNVSEISVTNTSEYNNSKSVGRTSEEMYCKPLLCCGGVHVHSYKDKQECEDIVYQGQWQRSRPKSPKKKIHNRIAAKKIIDSNNGLQKNNIKREDLMFNKNSVNIEPKLEVRKPLQVRNLRLQNTKQKDTCIKFEATALNTAQAILDKIRVPRSINNAVKVSSKIKLSEILSKDVKSTFIAKKPQITSSVSIKQKNILQNKRKTIPLLKNKEDLKDLQNTNLNLNINSIKSQLEFKKKALVPFMRSKTDEIRKDLLNFRGNLNKSTFLVFCNDEQKSDISTNEEMPTNAPTNSSAKDFTNKITNYTKRTLSPSSLNSSSGSSPNSIATVRLAATKSKNESYKKHSTPSRLCSSNNSESNNSTPTREKRLFKRCKSMKNNFNTSNKENVPGVTKNIGCKDIVKSTKSMYLGQRKSLYLTQMKKDRSAIQNISEHLSKHKTSNKSNIIPVPEDADEKRQSSSASIPRKRSLKSRASSINDNFILNKNVSYGNLECANTVLVIKQQELLDEPENQESLDDIGKNAKNDLLTEYFDVNSMDFAKELTEELLNSIRKNSEIVLSKDETTVNINESISSFKTVTADYCNNAFEESDIENSLNDTFETVLADECVSDFLDTTLNITDLSVTPVSNRSEYFLADSELKTALSLVVQTQKSTEVFNQSSVTDIFDRKEQRLVQAPPGFLSFQAFSGFSIDGEPVRCQPDPVSLIDSETGSLAIDVTRLLTSEELLISGRSSESYESSVDEDAVVPNWLFQIISQQQSRVEDQSSIGPQPQPLPEPMYDINGNSIEMGIIAVTGGAGDGRGIHSEPSQDSSGQGTSFSSSDTSSSPQSEAILIDPTTFTTQYEQLRSDIPSLVVTTGARSDINSMVESSRTSNEAESASHPPNHLSRPLNALSDIDADVSSIETDVPEFSDN